SLPIDRTPPSHKQGTEEGNSDIVLSSPANVVTFFIDFEHPNLLEYVEKLKLIPTERLIVENRKADSTLSEQEITDNELASIDMIKSALHSHGNLAIRSCCAPASIDELIRQREIMRLRARNCSLKLIYQCHDYENSFDPSTIRYGTDTEISLFAILQDWNPAGTKIQDDLITNLWHTK
ncbi:hypothetical protein PRIPAC_94361, partial [Pristionchus pacificus]|uniref:Uncharacterized protein n=1 Tax=Pristionchus pacificus TaxID=54126 RepID=A0A2A6BQ38_PRIPA